MGTVAETPLFDFLENTAAYCSSRSHTDHTMSTNDQITHMREFIMHEAKERCADIEDEATRTFTLDKQRMIETGKSKLRVDAERKKASVLAQHKINRSKAKSAARLICLQSMDKELEATFTKAADQLTASKSNSQQYGQLLVGLVRQAITKLRESNAQVYCLQSDLAIVKQSAATAVSEHQAATGKPIKLTVNETKFMPDAGEDKCLGGLMVRSECGNIFCKNTIESRLKIVSELCLPKVKAILFPHGSSLIEELDTNITKLMSGEEIPVDLLQC